MSLYDDMNQKDSLKKVAFFDFLANFKTYIVAYVNDQRGSTEIKDLIIEGTPSVITIEEGNIKNLLIKNTGKEIVFIGINQKDGAYQLSPGERIEFCQNKNIIVLCLNGTSSICYIQS